VCRCCLLLAYSMCLDSRGGFKDSQGRGRDGTVQLQGGQYEGECIIGTVSMAANNLFFNLNRHQQAEDADFPSYSGLFPSLQWTFPQPTVDFPQPTVDFSPAYSGLFPSLQWTATPWMGCHLGMVLHCRLSSEGRQRRINTKKGLLVHQKQLRKKRFLWGTDQQMTRVLYVSSVFMMRK
jgi:hypothetical protein